ncbi:MAG: IS66 family insertion sequence element accessory protein TnpB [Burkholderiales bacterium]|nr:IS66 family insertion sequence element accessory protein TnpB [Burkholderiales bacterium]
MIRIDYLWLAVGPMDMRAGSERLLARVVQVFGSAQAHHGYLFANARARIKLLVHDGFGSVRAETHFTPALLNADTSALAQRCAIRMAERIQRANCSAIAQ